MNIGGLGNRNGAAAARPMATRHRANAGGGDAKANIGIAAAPNRPKLQRPQIVNGNAVSRLPGISVAQRNGAVGGGGGKTTRPTIQGVVGKPAAASARADGIRNDDDDDDENQMDTDSDVQVIEDVPAAVAGPSTVSTALTHPTVAQKALFGKIRTRFCERPHNVPDIYQDDANNEQMMTAYVHHIFDYLHDIEASFTLPPKWLEGSEIQPRMRAILVDWMVSLHLKFRMQVDTLYLAVDLLDRFLALDDVRVTKDELQLVGVTCLFTASKFEEIYPPDVADYVYMADGACTKTDVLAMEMVVLHKLQFSLNAPLACKFLRRYAKAAESDTREYGISKYILEMTLLAPDMTCYKASFKASAAQLTAMLVLENYRVLQLNTSSTSSTDSYDGGENLTPSFRQPALTAQSLSNLWTPTMVFYSTYTVDDLLALVKKYLNMLDTAHHSTSKYLVSAGEKTNEFL